MNLLLSAAGFLVGAMLGIIPGLHPNLVISVFSAMSLRMENPAEFFIPLAVANIMFDSVPSSIFGVAEEGREASLSEAQRLAGRGMSWYACMKSAKAGFLGFLISSILFIPSLYIIPIAYGIISPHVLPLLIIIAGINAFMDGKNGFLLFFLSSLLGTFSFLLPVNSIHIFLPLLTGLFGMPYLILSMGSGQVKQTKQVPLHDSHAGIRRGALLGMFTNLLPALGASQFVFLASAMPINFLSFSTSLSASSTLFSIATVVSTGKARAGIAIPFMDFPMLWHEKLGIVLLSMASASLSFLAISWIAWPLIRVLSKAGKVLHAATVLTILAIVLATTGLYGLLVLSASTSLGLFATTLKARRTQLLGSIIYPTILLYSGMLGF